MKTPDQRRSRAQEIRGAKEFGGTVNPGSGNGWLHKADVRTSDYLIEYKTTRFDSYRLNAKDLNRLEYQALADSLEPVLIVEISGQEYAVITKDLFRTLIEDEA